MFNRLQPIEFIQRSPVGKTRPAFVICEDEAGEEISIVLKLSGRSERGVTGLAMEAFFAATAAALGLRVPQPYLVDLAGDWIDAAALADPAWAVVARESSPVGYGSRLMPDGFAAWVSGTRVPEAAKELAAGVLLFDAVSKNADRRPENPNCLNYGEDIRIIDHELCFPEFLLGIGDAWTVGGLQVLSTPRWHIFSDALRGERLDWTATVASWRGLSDDMLNDYGAAIPPEWAAARPVILRAIDRIKFARDNIDGCVAEVQRVLTC